MESVMATYLVFIQIDKENRVIDINSSAFLTDTSGWTEIDSGYGDKYHHAQGNYFPKPIMDDRGIYRYKLADGKAMERTSAEMDADVPEQGETSPTLERRVKTLETENQQLKEALELLLSGETEEEVTENA
ncbi:MAG: hypothetical protein J6K72_08360 [Clostridia bacterium]|nr:hypothetical protein [Clostridia bacterium]